MGKQAYYIDHYYYMPDMFCPKVSLMSEVTVHYNRLIQSTLKRNDSVPANLSLIIGCPDVSPNTQSALYMDLSSGDPAYRLKPTELCDENFHRNTTILIQFWSNGITSVYRK